MRADLAGDPSTLTIADELGIPIEHAVGLLHKFWCWADSQLTDGNAPTVTESRIDRFIGVTGFAKAVTKAGWLEPNGEGVHIPHFDNWMSQSAKTRLKTQRRVNKHRKPCNAPTVTKALPHNITLHNNKSLSKDSKALARSHMLPKAEQIYQAYPLKKGKKTAIKAILKALKEKTVEELLQAVAKYSLEMKGSEYIKHPATWFNAGCWDDEAAPKGNVKPEGVDIATGRIYPKKGKYAAYE